MIKRHLTDLTVVMGVLGLPLIHSSASIAQETVPPPQAAGRQMIMPEKGVCPLPILPALPTYEDTTFYSRRDVPRGTIEQVNYTNFNRG